LLIKLWGSQADWRMKITGGEEEVEAVLARIERLGQVANQRDVDGVLAILNEQFGFGYDLD
jgi:hypothetical protein